MFSSRFMLFPTFKKKNCVKHENLQFSLVNTITHEIIIALGPNLYHGSLLRYILGISLGPMWLIFVELSCLQAKIAIFMLKSTPITSKNGQGYFFLNLTKTLLSYIQCISLVPMRLIFAKLSCLQAIDVMTLKDWSRSSIFKLNQEYLRSDLVKFEDGWPWPIFWGHGSL